MQSNIIGGTPLPNAVIVAKRIAAETVVQEGRVQGARVANIRGTFACVPQLIPLHNAVDVVCTLEGFTYAIRGCAVTGMKLGVDENGTPMIEGYWIGGAYTCEPTSAS